jgi:ribonucleoside-diphosphate reductase alpha chain
MIGKECMEIMNINQSSIMPTLGQSAELRVTKRDGRHEHLDLEKIRQCFVRAAYDCMDNVSIDVLIAETIRNVYDKVTTQELESAMILAAVSYIEQDPAYDKVATRLLLQKLYREVLADSVNPALFAEQYRAAFINSIYQGVKGDVLHQKLLEFDLERLADGLKPERDHLFVYLGLQTLYERYFYKVDKRRYELPQTFWMRIAMGLALNEQNKEEKALQFYENFSTLRSISSTPTLFHSGYKIAQLSSCYLSTVSDDLGHIFKVIGDNAQLSKWAGGIGNDWTNIRGTGAFIKSIHATSQGVIPYLKIVNDVVVAITRSGIRRGGTCSYLETWHLDIEEFIDLRRNTGDERRRTHDMNTANWIPDLFMKRVMLDQDWTLFSPEEVPDLHDLYGKAFEKRYEEYEERARAGQIKLFKTISAQKLWRKMLSRLFETGHPWITFKDPCNVRSPQDHVGVVHSSNLCTEITLNTSADETAVCNLGSINLSEHVVNGQLDKELLAQSIRNAVRMLDNVIDLNFYPTAEARNSNMRHRPIGLGVMGFQDALFKLDIPFSSEKALWFSDYCQELVSYHAISASSDLAQERGAYQTYKGSKWDRGIFPVDTLALLEQERGMPVDVSRSESLDWASLRQKVKLSGMRNSNVMAIAPTATIANIAGCYPSIEPLYKNLYVKSNIAGEFTIVNRYLVNDLKKIGMWNRTMLEQLKFHDGDLGSISSIPGHLKEKYRSAFELDPIWLIKITAARGKWIDQSQSHNVFMKGVSGKKLNDIYMMAWQCGLKTTYYLRSLGATQIEKSTLGTEYGFTQKRDTAAATQQAVEQIADGKSCNPFDTTDCESCQ